MSDPISFDSSTPRYSLPNLFSGQAQKEIFVNEAFARLDSLIHAAIEGELSAPPASPNPGQCWLVGANPDGDWTGREGDLASWQGTAWLFVTPRFGLRMLDLSTGGSLFFDGDWQRPAAPAAPSGGTIVDAEARQAIVNLIETLQSAGIISPAN